MSTYERNKRKKEKKLEARRNESVERTDNDRIRHRRSIIARVIVITLALLMVLFFTLADFARYFN